MKHLWLLQKPRDENDQQSIFFFGWLGPRSRHGDGHQKARNLLHAHHAWKDPFLVVDDRTIWWHPDFLAFLISSNPYTQDLLGIISNVDNSSVWLDCLGRKVWMHSITSESNIGNQLPGRWIDCLFKVQTITNVSSLGQFYLQRQALFVMISSASFLISGSMTMRPWQRYTRRPSIRCSFRAMQYRRLFFPWLSY